MASRIVRQVRLADVGSDPPYAAANSEDTVWDATTSIKPDEPRYHGQSSSEVLFRDASIFRNGAHYEHLLPTVPTAHRRPEFWRPTSPEMRRIHRDPWQINSNERPSLELPPDDLMPIVLDAYFDNEFFPVIHRPMFEKQLREGLHLREAAFLRVVLLVCACGARWCNDPRVLDDRWPVPMSAGYRWLRQIDMWNQQLIERQISLWDAQALVLLTVFRCGSSAGYGVWIVIGVAIRAMQDIGSHRQKSHITLKNELHKRCFWSMIILDRFYCVHLGRHGAMQEIDSDLDNVLEVDDEFWSLEPNAPPPVQPCGVPSRLAMFNQLIGLCRIASRCLQTIHTLERTKRCMGLDGAEGALWMFKNTSMQLNQWVQGVPSHLSLPHSSLYTNSPLFSNTVTMWACYYELVVSVYRPFITKVTSLLAAPSMNLCLEAARAYATMIDTHRRTPGSRLLPYTYYPAFSCAMVLVIDLVAQGRFAPPDAQNQGPGVDATCDLYSAEQKEEDLRRCMRVLEWGETRFQIAGRLRDLVREFDESWRLQASSAPFLARLPKPVTSPSRSGISQVAIKAEPEITFDISGPPDPMSVLDLPTNPKNPLEARSDPIPDNQSANINAHAERMACGLSPKNPLQATAEPQPTNVLDTSCQLRPFHEEENQHLLTDAALVEYYSSMLEPGYNDALDPFQSLDACSLLQLSPPEMPYPDTFTENSTGSHPNSGSLIPSDSPTPLLAHWNTIMQNTLNQDEWGCYPFTTT